MSSYPLPSSISSQHASTWRSPSATVSRAASPSVNGIEDRGGGAEDHNRELGTLADELADGWDDEDEEGDGEYHIEDGGKEEDLGERGGEADIDYDDVTRARARSLQKVEPNGQQCRWSAAGNKGERDSGVEMASPDVNESETVSIGVLLESPISAIESLLRNWLRECRSPSDEVVRSVTLLLKDLRSQADVEIGLTRLITAHTALSTHLNRETQIFGSLSSTLLSPSFQSVFSSNDSSSAEFSTEVLDLLTTAISSLPNPSSTSLFALHGLSSVMTDLSTNTLSSLSDSLHMSREATASATRRLKVVRDVLADIISADESREEGIRWIESGGWDQRLREKHCASVCGDVVGGFEELCRDWRERLVRTATAQVPETEVVGAS